MHLYGGHVRSCYSESGHDFEYKPYWGCDLQTEHERYPDRAYLWQACFCHRLSEGNQGFLYEAESDDGKTVAAMDMLVPGVGELIGGSQREDRLDTLLAADYMNWGLERRGLLVVSGPAPLWQQSSHAGFGLGFERLIMYVTGMCNIRDVIPYPRTVKNLDF